LSISGKKSGQTQRLQSSGFFSPSLCLTAAATNIPKNMGTSIRHILVDQNDAVIRLSNHLFQRLWDNSQGDTLPQFAGCRVRWAEAVVELQDRKPVRMLRVVFCYLYFDHQGRLDRDKVMIDGALMMEAGIGSTAPAKSGSGHTRVV
jgi:hypothetical protein